MFSEAPLKGAGQHLTVPFNGATNVRLDLSPAAPGLPQDGQNGRAVIFHSFWRACPRQTLLVWQPPTQASRPNAFGRDLAPSRRYR